MAEVVEPHLDRVPIAEPYEVGREALRAPPATVVEALAQHIERPLGRQNESATVTPEGAA